MKNRRVWCLCLSLVLCSAAFAGLLISVGGTAHAQGNDRYVASSGTDSGVCTNSSTPCRTVQYAVDAASGGDTIKVATGIYTGVHEHAGVTQIVYLDKTITIRGGYTTSNWTTPDPEAHPTTLDGEGDGRVIYVTGDISPTLEGLRITGGYTAESGGGIFAYGAKLTVSHTLVASNTAEDKGGGIGIQATEASVTDCRIHSNVTAQQEGGGVGVYNGSHMNLVRSWVVANASPTNDGGGVFAGDGGSIYIENSIIAGNTANDSGGGLSLGDNGPHSIVNSHIVGNYADAEGGAIATYQPIYVVMTNTLIISNTGITGIDDEYGNSAVFQLNHCDTYGNSPDGTVGVIISRTNCLGSPPEDGLDPRMAGGALPGGVGPAFASQWLSYDYSLLVDSPAINAGTSVGAPATDIEGVRRIVPDLGAYEYVWDVHLYLPLVLRAYAP